MNLNLTAESPQTLSIYFITKYVTFCSCNNNHFNFFKGGTILGQPDSIVDLGHTQIPHDIFLGHLHDLAQSTFRLIAIKS